MQVPESFVIIQRKVGFILKTFARTHLVRTASLIVVACILQEIRMTGRFIFVRTRIPGCHTKLPAHNQFR